MRGIPDTIMQDFFTKIFALKEGWPLRSVAADRGPILY